MEKLFDEYVADFNNESDKNVGKRAMQLACSALPEAELGKRVREMFDHQCQGQIDNDLKEKVILFARYMKDVWETPEGESALVYAISLLRRYRRWETKLKQAMRDRDRKFPTIDGLREVNMEWTKEEEDAPIALAARIIGRSGR
jgi:hypothetical protein